MFGAIARAMTPPDLQQELMEKIAKDMAEDIDWKVMSGFLKEIGWIEIKIEWPRMTEGLAHEIKAWCRSNIKGHYKAQGRTWMFEEQKDATMFILRWS